MRQYRNYTLLIALAAGTVGVSLWAFNRWISPQTPPQAQSAPTASSPRLIIDPGIEKRLQLLAQLPQHIARAVQDLNLVAAVQLTYHTAYGRYATPEELKAAGFLAPAWPYSEQGRYQFSCEVDPRSSSFACYAVPLNLHDPFLRVDESQTIKVKFGEKPGSEAPLLEEVFQR